MRGTIPAALRLVAANAGDELSDAELVGRALAGESWAKETLFRRHFRKVTGTVMRLLGRREEAEDVVQDTFTVALTELERLRDPQAFEAWVLQIAVRNIYRRLRKRKLFRLLGLERGTDDASLAQLAKENASQDAHAELALLDRVLATLPGDQKLAWMLKHVEGEALDRVAQILGCSLATAKRRIKAAEERVAEHTGSTRGSESSRARTEMSDD